MGRASDGFRRDAGAPASEVLPGAGEVSDGDFFRGILDVLPAAVYVTDPAGFITYFNAAAAALWGQEPTLGESRWCGSATLFWPDGSFLPHDECPMAMALKDGRSSAGIEAVAERADGTRVPFMAYPTLLRDKAGAVVGAVNMLVDITERKRAEEHAQRLAAIVASSEDAIVSKDLDGIIRTWNQGAERLFGYAAEEIIGKSITLMIPPDRHDEEPAILARIRRGETIDHYETIRRRKDGSLVDISLTVSPIKSVDGRIVGASKIARDITERRRADERQRLLIREMAHRVKNLFAVSSGVVSLSARHASNPAELAVAIRERLGALSRAHSLILPQSVGDDLDAARPTTLHALIRTIVLPYEEECGGEGARVAIHGPDVGLCAGVVTSLALLLQEFATNAVKYGALSTPAGTVDVATTLEDGRLCLVWTERGGPPVGRERSEGFGTYLGQATVDRQLGGEISRNWHPDGVTIRLCVARKRLEG